MHGFKFRIACYYAITTVVVSCKVLNGPVFRICAVAAEAELQDMACAGMRVAFIAGRKFHLFQNVLL